MEKYCKLCGRVFKNSDFKICPYCGYQLSTRVGRQPIPRKLRHQVFERDGYRCRECGATNKQTRLHVDHIKPVSKGGTNDLSNLQTLCESCNRAKYTDEWVGGHLNNQFSSKNKNQEDTYNYIIVYGTKITKDFFNYLNNIDNEFLPFLCKYVGDERLSKSNKNKTINILIKNYSEMEIRSFIDESRIQYSKYGDIVKPYIPVTSNKNTKYDELKSIANNKDKNKLKEIFEDNIENLCRIYSIPNLGKKYVINRLINEYGVEEMIDKLIKYDDKNYSVKDSSNINFSNITYKICPKCGNSIGEVTPTCPYCGNRNWL